MENEILRDPVPLEEYILSVCLNNKTALARSVANLSAHRDFTGENQKAFGVIESAFHETGDADGFVMAEKWVSLGIFDRATARYIYSLHGGDSDFEPKIAELRRHGVFRRAKEDIHKMFTLTNQDITPDQLTSECMNLVTQWDLGATGKYHSSEWVEDEYNRRALGDHLRQGIPLLDDKIYPLAGQQRGTVKATMFREKHGKTRHACWEVAQDLRRGYRVLYITLEGHSHKIIRNMRELLQSEWPALKQNLFHRDSIIDSDEIQSAIIEWVFVEKGQKVVIDYLQRMQQPNFTRLSQNENGDRCSAQMTNLAVRFDLNMHILSQARQPEKIARGYSNVPTVYDCYGSKGLVRDASIILVGFRPKYYEELVIESPIGNRIKSPNGDPAPFNSVYVKPVLSREKMDYIHRWMHYIDTDEGMKLYSQDLL